MAQQEGKNVTTRTFQKLLGSKRERAVADWLFPLSDSGVDLFNQWKSVSNRFERTVSEMEWLKCPLCASTAWCKKENKQENQAKHAIPEGIPTSTLVDTVLSTIYQWTTGNVGVKVFCLAVGVCQESHNTQKSERNFITNQFGQMRMWRRQRGSEKIRTELGGGRTVSEQIVMGQGVKRRWMYHYNLVKSPLNDCSKAFDQHGALYKSETQ